MIILDGKKINKEIASSLKEAISVLNKKPKILIIQVGENQASSLYIKNKIKFAEKIGAKSILEKFSENTKEEDLVDFIKEKNNDSEINGIILQMPIPKNFNLTKILNTISPEKDIDGLGAINFYNLIRNENNYFVPATSKGILTLLEKNNISVAGKSVVIVGRSVLVGKSTAMYFLNHDATVTICHHKTPILEEYTKKADILIVATGHKGLINKKHVKRDQIIIDVGISVVDGKIYGDVEIDESCNVQALSPVPGGVGPMTVASLFENLIQAYRLQQ